MYNFKKNKQKHVRCKNRKPMFGNVTKKLNKKRNKISKIGIVYKKRVKKLISKVKLVKTYKNKMWKSATKHIYQWKSDICALRRDV